MTMAEFSRDNEYWLGTLIRDLNDALAPKYQMGALAWAEKRNQMRVDKIITDFQEALETRDPEIILAAKDVYKASMRRIYKAYSAYLAKKAREAILNGREPGSDDT